VNSEINYSSHGDFSQHVSAQEAQVKLICSLHDRSHFSLYFRQLFSSLNYLMKNNPHYIGQDNNDESQLQHFTLSVPCTVAHQDYEAMSFAIKISY
jgi:hypothetical protein